MSRRVRDMLSPKEKKNTIGTATHNKEGSCMSDNSPKGASGFCPTSGTSTLAIFAGAQTLKMFGLENQWD